MGTCIGDKLCQIYYLILDTIHFVKLFSESVLKIKITVLAHCLHGNFYFSAQNYIILNAQYYTLYFDIAAVIEQHYKITIISKCFILGSSKSYILN